MKKLLISILLVLSASAVKAQQLYTDNLIQPAHSMTRSFHYPWNGLTLTVDFQINRVFRTQVDLNRTLFGRAMSGMGQAVKQAWSQGYTGQNVNIGILDAIRPNDRRFPIVLSNVNVRPQALTQVQYTVNFEYQGSPQRNRSFQLSSEHDTPWRVRNNGTFSGRYTHGQIASLIAGGRHTDADGTVLYGIAKDANITFIQSDYGNYAAKFTQKPFDFINASLSRTIAYNREFMENLYTAIDRSGKYSDGKLPVYITSGGNYHYTLGTPTYEGLKQGRSYIADYNAVTMAMSDNTHDGRPLSDYLLVVGADHGITNRPGEVVELQKRWIVAPYHFPTDRGTLQGTSFSTPFVTGIAGVVKSKFPTLDPADVANLLLETARDIGAPGMDAVYGRGMVDLANALSPQ